MSQSPKPKPENSAYEQSLQLFAHFSETRPRNLMLFGNPGALHLQRWMTSHEYHFTEILYPKAASRVADGDHFIIRGVDDFRQFMAILKWGDSRTTSELRAMFYDALVHFDWQADTVRLAVHPGSKREAFGLFLKDDYIEWWTAAVALANDND